MRTSTSLGPDFGSGRSPRRSPSRFVIPALHSSPSRKVLEEAYDPPLSGGSARPAVFRSSTYVFSSPEAAERAFDVASGRAKVAKGESPDLIYSRSEERR